MDKAIRNLIYGLCACICLGLLFIRFRLLFSYSVDLDGSEFAFVHYVQLLLQGKPIYTDPEHFPFLSVLYFPLYPYLLCFLCKLLGYGSNIEPDQLLILARSLSFFVALVNIFLIYRIFKRLNFSFIYFAAGITFYLLLVTAHFYVTRPDALKAMFFSLFLLSVLQFAFLNGGRKFLVLAILSALIAILFKQDMVLYIYLVLFSLCFALKNRQVAYLFIGFTVSLAGLLLLCYLVFGYEFFANTLLLNVQVTTNVFQTYNPLFILFSIARTSPFLLLIFYSYKHGRGNRMENRTEYFVLVAAMLFFIVVHLMMFRAGANLNYTHEMILLMVLGAAFFIRSNMQAFVAKMKYVAGLSTLYLIFLFGTNTVIRSYSYSSERETQHQNDYTEIIADRKAVRADVGNELVFFPNPRFVIFFPETNLIYGYEMHFDRMVEILHGVKSTSKLLFISDGGYDAYFSDGRVKFIIAGNDDTSKFLMQRDYPDYQLYKQHGFLSVYRYKV